MAYESGKIDDFRGGLNTNNLPWDLTPQGGAPPQQRPDIPTYAGAAFGGGGMQFPAMRNLLCAVKPGQMVQRGGQHTMIPSQPATPHGFFQFRNEFTQRLMLAIGGSIQAWTIDPAMNAVTLTPPAAPLTSAAGAAGLLDSRNLPGYQWYYSFIDTNGKESGLSPVSTPALALALQQASLTGILVSGSLSIVARNLYRTGGTSSLVEFVAKINDNTTTTYTDNTADSALSAAQQYAFTGTIYSAADATAEVNFEAMYDRLVFSDGVNAAQKWGGSLPTCYQLGITPPTRAPQVEVAIRPQYLYGIIPGPTNKDETNFGGANSYGAIVRYKPAIPTAAPTTALTAVAGSPGALTSALGFEYGVSFLDVNGDETPLGPYTGALILTAQQANLSAIPIGPVETTASRNIYRKNLSTKAFGLVTTLNDNSTTTYTDNTLDSALKAFTDPYKPAVVYSFYGSDGTTPAGDLCLGNDGNFYGCCSGGGVNGAGTFYQFDPINLQSPVTKFYDFTSTDIADPKGSLTLGPDGAFYGVGQRGGTKALGGIFKITAGGAFTPLYNFDGTHSDAGSGSLTYVQQEGLFYGVTSVDPAFVSLAAGNAQVAFAWNEAPTRFGAVTYNLYQSTTSGGTIGTAAVATGLTGNSHTIAGLVNGTEYFFSIAVVIGGVTSRQSQEARATPDAVTPLNPRYFGNIFSMDLVGNYTNMYSFNANQGTKGCQPIGALVYLADALYGVTRYGGTNYGGVADTGDGVVFKITPASVYTALHLFNHAVDGGQPAGGLILGIDGTTLYGVTTISPTHGVAGTLFSSTTAGVITTVYDFSGYSPQGPPYQHYDGRFFGMGTSEDTGSRYWEWDGTIFVVMSDLGTASGGWFPFPTGGEPPLEVFGIVAGPGNLNSNDTLPGASGLSTYKWYVTYVNAQGTESNPSPATMGFVATYQAIELTDIPVSTDPQVTARNIYRSGGTSAEIRYVGTIKDNTTTTFFDNTADIDLSLLLASFAHDVLPAPPNGPRYFFSHGNRLWAWGNPALPYLLYVSTLQEPEYFPTILETPSIDGARYNVNPKLADAIIGMGETGSAALVFNENSVYTVIGSTFDPTSGQGFSSNPIAGSRGCISRKSIVSGCGDGEDVCVYLSTDGQVYKIGPGGHIKISQDIETTLRAVAVSDLETAYATYVDLGYHLFIPQNGGSLLGFRYDFRTDTWSDMSDDVLTGQAATSTPTSPGQSVGGEVWFETAAGYIIDGVAYNGIVSALSPSDATNQIPVAWLSPEFEYGKKMFVNKARRIRIEGSFANYLDGQGNPTNALRLVVNALTPGQPTVTQTFICRGTRGVICDRDVAMKLEGVRLQIGLQGDVSAIAVQSVNIDFTPDIREVMLTRDR